MDETKNNVPETEEEFQSGEEINAQENEEAKALETELEEIRDMFQSELDKARNGEENNEVLIQELDEIEDEDESAEDEEIRLCECCGEKRRDTSFGDDYPYCNECRELMKSNPLNIFGVVMAVVMFIVAGFSLGLTAKNSESFIDLLDANSAYAANQLVDAATTYEAYMQSVGEGDSISMRAVKNVIDIMAKLGYYSDANNYVETYFSDSALNLPWNKKYAKVKEDYELLMESSQLINENFGDALNGEKFDYDKAIKRIDKIIKENEQSGQYSQTFLEYAKYLLMLVHEEDNKTQLKQLLKTEEVDNGQFPWIYLTYIMNIYGNMGDSENAQKYFEKCIAINSQELSVYNAYADSIRFSKKVDADKILEIAQQAAAVASQGTYPIFYRTYAIAYLLKGDAEKAMTNMEQYLQNCQQSVSDFNLYALCALETGDKDGYKEAKDTLEMYGYKIGSSVEKYKNGKMTLEQVLLEKGGDI